MARSSLFTQTQWELPPLCFCLSVAVASSVLFLHLNPPLRPSHSIRCTRGILPTFTFPHAAHVCDGKKQPENICLLSGEDKYKSSSKAGGNGGNNSACSPLSTVVRIIDFGTAEFCKKGKMRHALVGTRQYRSPEVMFGRCVVLSRRPYWKKKCSKGAIETSLSLQPLLNRGPCNLFLDLLLQPPSIFLPDPPHTPQLPPLELSSLLYHASSRHHTTTSAAGTTRSMFGRLRAS